MREREREKAGVELVYRGQYRGAASQHQPSTGDRPGHQPASSASNPQHKALRGSMAGLSSVKLPDYTTHPHLCQSVREWRQKITPNITNIPLSSCRQGSSPSEGYVRSEGVEQEGDIKECSQVSRADVRHPRLHHEHPLSPRIISLSPVNTGLWSRPWPHEAASSQEDNATHL